MQPSALEPSAVGAAPRPAVFPDYTRTVTLKHVKRGFAYLCRYATTLLLVPLAGVLALELANLYRTGELARLAAAAAAAELSMSLVAVVACVSVAVSALLAFWLLQGRPVYLVDFAVYQPPDSWKWSKPYAIQMARRMLDKDGKRIWTDDTVDFQVKVLVRSGLGDETYLPPCMNDVSNPYPSMALARWEFEQVCFTAIKDAMNKTGITARQIGVVIVNCSLFNPTPSLSATIMNHFKMSSSVINYNLSGMGCSAGVIAIDLARQMLQLYPNTYALVVSTENITQNRYYGNQKSMLIPNTIFRVGGAAMILSNKRRDAWRAKYKLQHVVRTHLGAKTEAFNTVYECEDALGNRGVRLSKELMSVAGEALKANITTLGPLVLPISEQLIFAANLIARKLLGKKALKPYVPDFSLAFEHVCIHTGGRAVVDEIEKQLSLSKELVEPSRAGLYRYGNVSSSSIWYVLAFIESHKGLRSGDRVWQLAFGSGFKCNSTVWKANRRIRDRHPGWEGFDIERMYVDLAAMPK